MSDSDYQRLQTARSLGEILAVAIEFERTARDFYRMLAPRVSKRIRYLVEEL
ncbi:MAG: rubrerythrin, partial [Candidatus Sedimenticola endophacoides]